MGFQFVHIESYSRKADKGGRTVSFVLDEASREPAASTHVEAPKPPEVVYGVGLDEVRHLHDAAVLAGGTVDKTGKARRLRVDQHTLMTVVASHPGGSPEDVARWEGLVVDWLKQLHGDRLLSVVRHVDEAYPHLHCYLLPAGPAVKARELHPGVVSKEQAKCEAKAEGLDDKAANAMGDRAYKAAMRAFQDGYWEAVGMPCGQARIGPGRRRLSRDEWQAEKEAARHGAELVAKAEAAGAVVETAESRGAEARETIAKAEAAMVRLREMAAKAKAAMDAAEVRRAEAEASREAAEAAAERARREVAEAARRVARAEREAAGILGRARAEASRLRDQGGGLGMFLGGILLGLVGASPRRAAERGAAAARAAAERAAEGRIKEAEGKAETARRIAAEAQREAGALRESFRELQGREALHGKAVPTDSLIPRL